MRLCLVLCLLAAGIPASAEPWQQLGPYGATVAAMAGVPGYPDELYFAADGRPCFIHHTTDAGNTWTVVETLPDPVVALVTDPVQVRTVYAATITGHVYRSTDAGQTWPLRGTMPGVLRVRQMVLNSANRSELFAVAEQPGADSTSILLLHSVNSGTSWTAAHARTSFEAVAPLLFVVPSPAPAVFVGGSVGNQPCLLHTINNGGSWTDLSADLGGRCAYAVHIPPSDSLSLICATDAGVFYSDEGAPWTRRVAAPAYSLVFATDGTGYAGGENLLYRSNDGGWSWSADTTQFTGSVTRWLWSNPEGPLELYAGSGVGLFHTTNGGYDWSPLADGHRLLTTPWLYFAPPGRETLYVCPPGCGILKSGDRGATWTRLSQFPGSVFATGMSVNPRNSDTMVVVTALDADLRRTTDRGDSWQRLPIADDFEPKGVLYHQYHPDTLYTWGGLRPAADLPTRFAILKSTDRGLTWNTLLAQGTSGICVGFNYYCSTDSMFAWGSVAGQPAILYSTNRGATWADRTSGLTGAGPVREMWASLIDRRTIYCPCPDGVFRSDNRGVTWTSVGLTGATTVLPDTSSVNTLVAGTDTAGIWYTTNNGFLWNPDTVGLVSRAATFLLRHPRDRRTTYCGTFGASLLAHNAIGIAEDEGQPADARLRVAVMPGIVRDRVSIRLAPAAGRTTIDLYSPDGRMLGRIADLASRPARFCWRVPAEVSAGIYLLVCRSNGRENVARICLFR